MPLKILFVCTGNTCRSAMAEGLFRKLGEGRDFSCASAGLAALPGMSASGQARQVMKVEGIDIDGHRATLLSDKLLEDSDIVLTMTADHREYISNRYPQHKNKIFCLKEYAGKHGDVSDPYGQPVPAYQACAVEIKSLLKKIIEKLGRN